MIFIDFGDTIIDEATKLKDADEIVQSAQVIQSAHTLLRTLKDRGYRVAMVADSYTQSFYNMYTGLGLLDCSEALVFSADVGENKPPGTARCPPGAGGGTQTFDSPTNNQTP